MKTFPTGHSWYFKSQYRHNWTRWENNFIYKTDHFAVLSYDFTYIRKGKVYCTVLKMCDGCYSILLCSTACFLLSIACLMNLMFYWASCFFSTGTAIWAQNTSQLSWVWAPNPRGQKESRTGSLGVLLVSQLCADGAIEITVTAWCIARVKSDYMLALNGYILYGSIL